MVDQLRRLIWREPKRQPVLWALVVTACLWIPFSLVTTPDLLQRTMGVIAGLAGGAGALAELLPAEQRRNTAVLRIVAYVLGIIVLVYLVVWFVG
ncbi:MAG: hypothetical protein M3281_00730 [Chloroflexota bacterium]|nr:hypothetical protein [Chloroflexota bacterium]